MKKKNIIAMLALSLGLVTGSIAASFSTNKQPVDYVDPMLGTASSRWMLSPGYYAVTLDDYNIRAELTATTRAGFQRYTFQSTFM